LICKSCLKELDCAHRFRLKCIKADRTIHSEEMNKKFLTENFNSAGPEIKQERLDETELLLDELDEGTEELHGFFEIFKVEIEVENSHDGQIVPKVEATSEYDTELLGQDHEATEDSCGYAEINYPIFNNVKASELCLNRHSKRVHDFKPTLTCDLCGEQFLHKGKLEKHVRHMHSGCKKTIR
jgi:hypothetical protein